MSPSYDPREAAEEFFTLDPEQAAHLEYCFERSQASLSKHATRDNEAVYEMEGTRGIDPIRTPFTADVDRVINNPFFTRTADKTQVFSLYRNDDITRRGFHIQLVAQTAVKIGAALGLNLPLIQAIGLGHDAGHTPFGHAGEHFLSEIYHERTGRYFNHNVHSVRALRSVTPCNLSLQTYNGMLCHCGENNFAEYATEPCPTFADLDALMERCYTEKGLCHYLRPSTLEGCVVRICDILAYLGKDRQDALSTGVITRDEYYLDSFLGTNNSEIIRNASVNIVKNSLGRDCIAMDPEVSDEIRRLKAANYESIYSYDGPNGVLSQVVRPMMHEMYVRLIDDLERGDESSPVFTAHINSWFIENRNPGYASNPPDEIVTDYIASMTDDYFIALYKHLFPDDPKSQLELYEPYFEKAQNSNIANTGEIPKPVQTPCNIESATDRLIQLRAKIPQSEFLENLTPEGLKEELKGKHG